jgi:BlaI family transcriptional regulator, penicillinase repressor
MNISDAEWIVMQAVWRLGRVGAAEVIEDVLPQTDWSHRTVRTLLNRLVDKGALEASMEGNRNLYRTLVSESLCVREESRTFVKKVFGGDAGALLAHFVDHESITPEQLDELKSLLEKKQQEREDAS